MNNRLREQRWPCEGARVPKRSVELETYEGGFLPDAKRIVSGRSLRNGHEVEYRKEEERGHATRGDGAWPSEASGVGQRRSVGAEVGLYTTSGTGPFRESGRWNATTGLTARRKRWVERTQWNVCDASLRPPAEHELQYSGRSCVKYRVNGGLRRSQRPVAFKTHDTCSGSPGVHSGMAKDGVPL